MKLFVQHITLLIGFLVCTVLGCGSNTYRVARVPSNPIVPEHPLREQLIGSWLSEGEVALTVTYTSDGKVVIESPEDTVWENVVNNVRFEGNELHYDHFYYYIGSENFSMPGNVSGDHPFSGVCNRSVILPLEDDKDQLQTWIISQDGSEPERFIYVRRQ